MKRVRWGLGSTCMGTAFAFAVGCSGQSGPSGDLDDLELVDGNDPSFAPAVVTVPLNLALTPMALELGDFDGDGNTDLLVAGVEAGVGVTAAIFLGDGHGEFAPGIDPGYEGCSAFPVVGDLTGDDRTDVITLGCANNLNVFQGQSDGTLAPWEDWPDPTYGSVSSSVITDFEGDGDADLISLRVPDSAYLDLTLGNGGHGVWSVSTTEIGNPDWSDFGPVGVVAGHFDQDGIVDVALLDREYDITTLHGTAPANFAFPREIGVDVAPWSVRAGDLDSDGLTDLVVSSYTEATLQVQRTAWSGGFVAHPITSLAGFTPYDTAIGDITGDGHPDVAMVSNDDARLYWLPGDGTGGLGQLQRFGLPSPAVRIHAGFIDDDGAADLVAATFADGSVTLVLSGGGA